MHSCRVGSAHRGALRRAGNADTMSCCVLAGMPGCSVGQARGPTLQHGFRLQPGAGQAGRQQRSARRTRDHPGCTTPSCRPSSGNHSPMQVPGAGLCLHPGDGLTRGTRAARRPAARPARTSRAPCRAWARSCRGPRCRPARAPPAHAALRQARCARPSRLPRGQCGVWAWAHGHAGVLVRTGTPALSLMLWHPPPMLTTAGRCTPFVRWACRTASQELPCRAHPLDVGPMVGVWCPPVQP